MKWELRMGLLFSSFALGISTVPAQENATNPAAASGMTQGLPGVSTQRQAELMHVRARAQAARPEAEKAAMERSAETALAQKSEQQVLSDARETKRLKEEAARQLQIQRAANAYQGVSAREMSSWADNSGRVKVDGGIPAEVLAALPPDEPMEEEPQRFRLLNVPKKAVQGVAGAAGVAAGAAKKGVSIIPGVGRKKDDDPYASSEGSSYTEPPTAYTPDLTDTGEDKGFFRKVGSKIPFVGGGNNDEVDPYASGDFIDQGASAAYVGPSAPSPASTVGPTASPISRYDGGQASVDPGTGMVPVEEEKSGFFQKFRKSEPGSDQIPSPEPMIADSSQGEFSMEEEKPGFGSGIKNFVGKIVPGGNNNAGFSGGEGTIDASLFPQEGDPEEMMADASAGRPKFFKKPNLELPDISMPGSNNQETPKPEIPVAKKDRSPVHSGGSAYYVVQSNGAQFMRFSGGPLGSEAQTLSEGTRVKMTKVGDEWSSIQLSNGSTGIIKNKDLRPAGGSSDGVGAAATSVATSSPVPSLPNRGGFTTTSSGGARITSPVSATGAGISDVPGPPVSIPESGLPPVAESAVSSIE